MDHGHGTNGSSKQDGRLRKRPSMLGFDRERKERAQDQQEATKFGASASPNQRPVIAIITDDDEQMKHGMEGRGFSSSAPSSGFIRRPEL